MSTAKMDKNLYLAWLAGRSRPKETFESALARELPEAIERYKEHFGELPEVIIVRQKDADALGSDTIQSAGVEIRVEIGKLHSGMFLLGKDD